MVGTSPRARIVLAVLCYTLQGRVKAINRAIATRREGENGVDSVGLRTASIRPCGAETGQGSEPSVCRIPLRFRLSQAVSLPLGAESFSGRKVGVVWVPVLGLRPSPSIPLAFARSVSPRPPRGDPLGSGSKLRARLDRLRRSRSMIRPCRRRRVATTRPPPRGLPKSPPLGRLGSSVDCAEPPTVSRARSASAPALRLPCPRLDSRNHSGIEADSSAPDSGHSTPRLGLPIPPSEGLIAQVSAF